MSIYGRTLAQLDGWGLAETAEGACALDLARRLDDDASWDRPTASSQLHGQLGARLAELRKLAPETGVSDGVDDLTARRAERRRAASQ